MELEMNDLGYRYKRDDFWNLLSNYGRRELEPEIT
jgi:hypothetical protein